jgi:hypothetical protein
LLLAMRSGVISIRYQLVDVYMNKCVFHNAAIQEGAALQYHITSFF